MSTEIYPPLPQTEITRLEEDNRQKEQRWLIGTLIKPELDNVIEALSRCVDLIAGTDDVKLPLTSSRTEQAKGVLTRSSSEVVDLDVNLHLSAFSKRMRLKLKPNAHIEMEQITTLIRVITDTITAVLMLKNHDSEDVEGFLEQLRTVMANLTRCNSALNKPPERLLFPQHKIDLEEIFESEGNKLHHYKDRMTMDFFLLNGEVSVEIKALHIVTEEPWCHVDPKTGKSHIDKLKDDLKHRRINISDVLKPQEAFKRGLQALGINKYGPEDYFTRGVTFDGHVVIEVEKAVIHCQDPHLLSVQAKLNGLEHMVMKMYSNLDLAMM